MSLSTLAIVAALTAIAIEIFLRLPFRACAQLMLRISQKASATISSKAISDHWKEKVLLRYSCILAGQSLKLAALFSVVVIVVVVFAAGIDLLIQPPKPSLQVLAGWPGLVTASVIAVLYFNLRKRFVS